MKSENTTAIDWRRESPLLQHVQLGDVVFMDQPVSAATAKDDAFANLGFEILAQGPRGPSSSSAPTAAASSPASPPRSPATTPSPTAPPPRATSPQPKPP
ncbi:MAG: hypothetical protein DVB27_04000, partial [Verrucomicrobia bacterium]